MIVFASSCYNYFKGRRIKQVITALMAMNPFFGYGMLLGWVSPSMNILQTNGTVTDTPLSSSDISWMASAMGIGAVVGSFIFSFISGKLGRKFALWLLGVPQLVCWVLKLIYVNPIALILARLLSGISAGAMYTLPALYIKEMCDADIKGTLNTICLVVNKIGILIAYTTGTYLNYYTNIWIMLLAPAFHLVVFPFLPESPAYLLHVGKRKEARQNIAWLRNIQDTNKEVDEIEKTLELENQKVGEKTTLRDLLKDKSTVRACVIAVVLRGTQVLGGAAIIIAYASSILGESDLSQYISANEQTIGLGIVQIVGCLIAASLVDKAGRRPLLFVSCAVSILFMAALGVWFLLKDIGLLAPSWIPVAAVFLAAFITNAGSGPLSVVIAAEIFSYEARMTMNCIIDVISWTAYTVALKLYQPITEHVGACVPFFIFSAVLISSFIYLFIVLPESKGKSLNLIREQLVKGRHFKRIISIVGRETNSVKDKWEQSTHL